MSNDNAASFEAPSVMTRAPRADARGSFADRALLAVLKRMIGRLERSVMTISMPSGAATSLGQPHAAGRPAAVRFNSKRGLWRTLTRGKLGFAEAYMDGDVDVDDLDPLFHWVIDNEAALQASARWFMATPQSDKAFHASRDNTRDGSRRNIADHYDLGNDFYRRWLDAGMSYSSAIYAEADDTLERAQARKHERILAALDLAPGHRVLEIGCGWGSLLEAVASRGAHVRGITLSKEQLAWSRTRLEAAGLSDRAELAFEDYRDTSGHFDRLVSIEMIEAVGERHWPGYFQTLADRLVPGGHGVLQAITIPERCFDDYRSTPDFIQRYIFPGGMLPTLSAMEHHARLAGLRFSTIERFGPSYARTLRDWSQRFNAAWPQIVELGFDERFRRMWNFYLSYCAVGFERQCIDVGLYRVDKI